MKQFKTRVQDYSVEIATAVCSIVLLFFSDLNLQFERLVRAVIFCDIPEHFRGIVHASYTQAFQAYQIKSRKENKMDTSGIA